MVAAQLAAGPGGSYGVHSEMFSDGLMQLHQAGKVTNDAKSLFNGVSVTTFALGSSELYRWLDDNDEVAFVPVHIVNDPSVIARNHAFVSINGALSIDLYGQVVADNIDGRQISGVGGHEDFVAAAELRLDDHSLICLRSTAEVDGATRSRIVPLLPEGSVVSTPRHHTGVVDHRVRGGRPLRAHRARAGRGPGRDRPSRLPGRVGPGGRVARAFLNPWCPNHSGAAPGPATLTLASFNVHMGVDGWGRPYDLVGQCRALGADILVIQESFRPDDGGPSTAGIVAAELGYEVVEEVGLARAKLFDPVPTSSTRWAPWPSQVRKALRLDGEGRRSRHGPAARGFRRGQWGVAVLARVPVTDVGVIRLGQLRRDPARRVVVHCSTVLGGRTVQIFGTHMSHITHGSRAQYRELSGHLPHPDHAAVLTGDMNLWGPPVNSYFPAWRRAVVGRTWPTRHPHSQLDHVLITPALSVVAARVADRSGSDHRPVVVTLALA